MIGCEFANDLSSQNIVVDAIDIGEHALGRLAPVEIARALESSLTEKGVNWHWQKEIASVDKNADGFTIRFNDESSIDVDLVLSAVGLRPRTDLAEAADIKLDRGIAVDNQLRSSNADIYAIGDCAAVNGTVLPVHLTAHEAGEAVLAQILSGESAKLEYDLMPVVVKTAYPLTILPPNPGTEGKWTVEENGKGLVARFVHEDQVLGFALGGEPCHKADLLKEMQEATVAA